LECGKCCQFLALPISNFSNDTKDWILAHNLTIVPVLEENYLLIGNKCMYYDEKTKKCDIYERRFKICRRFENGSSMCDMAKRIEINLKVATSGNYV
jgi:Fe-S-cluster containining protein